MSQKCILILGGARSGKSHFAQGLAARLGERVLYVAPAEALDEDMRRRIEIHKKRRPSTWRTLEAPANLSRLLREHIEDAEVVLIDCLTLLVANFMPKEDDALDRIDYETLQKQVTDELEALIALFDESPATFIIVSNEVGMGLVPPYRSGRIYRDVLGIANQTLARYADEVYFMVAGIPSQIKP